MRTVNNYESLEAAGKAASECITTDKPAKIQFTLPDDITFSTEAFWNELCKNNPKLIFVIHKLETRYERKAQASQFCISIIYSAIAFDEIFVVHTDFDYKQILIATVMTRMAILHHK